jgi:hypothetical protein
MSTVSSGSIWPQERVDQLRELYAQGLTYSQIGNALDVERSSVAGKVARLGLPKRGTEKVGGGSLQSKINAKKRWKGGNLKKANKLRAANIVAPKPIKTEATPDIHALIAIPTNNFMDQESGLCKWPHGPECGDKAIPLRPYCTKHEEQSRA